MSIETPDLLQHDAEHETARKRPNAFGYLAVLFAAALLLLGLTYLMQQRSNEAIAGLTQSLSGMQSSGALQPGNEALQLENEALRAENEALRAENEALRGQVGALNAEINRLQTIIVQETAKLLVEQSALNQSGSSGSNTGTPSP